MTRDDAPAPGGGLAALPAGMGTLMMLVVLLSGMLQGADARSLVRRALLAALAGTLAGGVAALAWPRASAPRQAASRPGGRPSRPAEAAGAGEKG